MRRVASFLPTDLVDVTAVHAEHVRDLLVARASTVSAADGSVASLLRAIACLASLEERIVRFLHAGERGRHCCCR
jgi:hypothetical protein